MADDGTRVAFDRDQYRNVERLVQEVEASTDDAIYGDEGYAIGTELRAQPLEARWEMAAKVGSDVSALAGQVRDFTDRFTEKRLPDFRTKLQKAERLFDETDDLSTASASGSGAV